MRGNSRSDGEAPAPKGPLIEGDLVVRGPTWRRRAARWVYAGSRRAARTYGLRGLVLRLLAVATVLTIVCTAAICAAVVFTT